MKDHLNKLPQEIQELIQAISAIAHGHKVPVYLVGGFVRDLLLGVKNLDLDILIEGDGIAFAEECGRFFNARVIRHKRFGTATVFLRTHSKIDIATARRESYPHPGHLPVVERGVLKEDLFRRDFTINAMAIDIGRERFGALIDYFGGRNDLAAGLVRVLHEVSFLDDPTRILRAVRFEQRYDLRIEPRTLRLIKEAVTMGMPGRVEPQRIRDDLILLLKEKEPIKSVRRLQKLAGFTFISPHLSVSMRTYNVLHAIQKQIAWFERFYSHRRQLDAWLLYFIGLTESLSPEALKTVLGKFAFKNGEAQRIEAYRFLDRSFLRRLRRKEVKPSAIFGFFEPLSYEVILALKAANKNRQVQKHIEDFFEIYNGMRISISGHDLHSLGMPPGPVYQEIFTQVLHAKLDGIIRTKEEEILLIKELIAMFKKMDAAGRYRA